VNLKNITNKEHIISSHGASDNLILPGPPRELQVTLRVKF
jgi:catecholate siderophore receptor